VVDSGSPDNVIPLPLQAYGSGGEFHLKSSADKKYKGSAVLIGRPACALLAGWVYAPLNLHGLGVAWSVGYEVAK
jgi:hypothetical protein